MQFKDKKLTGLMHEKLILSEHILEKINVIVIMRRRPPLSEHVLEKVKQLFGNRKGRSFYFFKISICRIN